MKEKIRLGIVGSRRRNSWIDKCLIRQRILELKPIQIISGGCSKGADRFAEELAAELNIPIKIVKPKEVAKDASYHERVKAFYDRNLIIAMLSHRLIALVAPDRKGGTENTIQHFKDHKRENDLEIIDSTITRKIYGYPSVIERPIRFFCRFCGKELFELAEYEKEFYGRTLEEMIGRAHCSDCLLELCKEEAR